LLAIHCAILSSQLSQKAIVKPLSMHMLTYTKKEYILKAFVTGV